MRVTKIILVSNLFSRKEGDMKKWRQSENVSKTPYEDFPPLAND